MSHVCKIDIIGWNSAVKNRTVQTSEFLEKEDRAQRSCMAIQSKIHIN